MSYFLSKGFIPILLGVLASYLIFPPVVISEYLIEYDFYSSFEFDFFHSSVSFAIFLLYLFAGILLKTRTPGLGSSRCSANLKNLLLFSFYLFFIIYVLLKFDLIIYVLQHGIFSLSRTDSIELFADVFYSPYISYLFSFLLVNSFFLAKVDVKAPIICLFIFGVMLDAVFGARINFLRFIVVFVALFNLNRKGVTLVLLLFALLVFSRALFSGYSASNIYDIIILGFGDQVNIFLGQHLLLNATLNSCGIDGLHFIRSLIPPFMRGDLVDFYFPDVANICMNKVGLIGYGGSPFSDLLFVPLSFLSSTLLLIFIYIFNIHYLRIGLLKVFLLILIISCLPYFLRNGHISTINYISTMYFWVFLPLFGLFSLFRKRFK